MRSSSSESHRITIDKMQRANDLRRNPPELDDVDRKILDDLDAAKHPSRPIDCWDENASLSWNYARGPFVPDESFLRRTVARVAFIRSCFDDDWMVSPMPAQWQRWILERIAVVRTVGELLPTATKHFARLEAIYRTRMKP